MSKNNKTKFSYKVVDSTRGDVKKVELQKTQTIISNKAFCLILEKMLCVDFRHRRTVEKQYAAS